MTTMLYRRGDVVLVPFPYAEDFSVTKQRPAVVVSSPKKPSDEITIAMVTSVRKPSDAPLHGWKSAGLLHQSYVRAKLVTIDPALTKRKIGKLSESDLESCLIMLRMYFGL